MRSGRGASSWFGDARYVVPGWKRGRREFVGELIWTVIKEFPNRDYWKLHTHRRLPGPQRSLYERPQVRGMGFCMGCKTAVTTLWPSLNGDKCPNAGRVTVMETSLEGLENGSR